MKRPVVAITLLMTLVFTGCSFETTGTIIQKYESPKTALLVLDMQEDFLGDSAKMPISRDQIPGITRVVNGLVAEFERTDQPIIYVKSEFPTRALGNRIRHYAAIEGSPGTKIFGQIRISGSAIFSKKEPDAFSSPEFEQYLVSHQINQLVITGVYADQCVLYTTFGAINRQYQVKFIKNGVGSNIEDVQVEVKEVNRSPQDTQTQTHPGRTVPSA